MSLTHLRGTPRQYLVAVRALIALTAITVLYTLLITAVGQIALPHQANGSMLTRDGRTVGSSLLGQSFTTAKGAPLTQWFQTRPSAAGDGYDGGASSASNLGPNNPDLVAAIRERKQLIERTYGVRANQVPADAVTASGSGLDPDISPAYAELQVTKVAETRGIARGRVEALVQRYTHGAELGFLGQPTVDVLQLNAALATLDPAGNAK